MPGMDLGRAAIVAGRASASLKHGIWMISFVTSPPPKDQPLPVSLTPISDFAKLRLAGAPFSDTSGDVSAAQAAGQLSNISTKRVSQALVWCPSTTR